MSSIKSPLVALVAAVSLAGALSARAATIVFDSGHTFTDSTQLLAPTGGYAVNFGGNALTTATSSTGSGVAFEAGPATTGSSSVTGLGSTTSASGNVTLLNLGAADPTVASFSNIRGSSSYFSTSTIPVKSSVTDANFATAIAAADYAGTPSGTTDPFEITLHNLIVGDSYTVQLYLVDARTTALGSAVGLANAYDPTTSTLTTPTLVQYGFGATGNTTVGAYVLGTFVADAADQSFFENTYSSTAATTSKSGQINALVLQDNSTAAAPEPASLSLLALGACGLLARRRR